MQAHYNEAVPCLNFGTPENDKFSIWDKWKNYYFSVFQFLSTLGYVMRLFRGHLFTTSQSLSLGCRKAVWPRASRR